MRDANDVWECGYFLLRAMNKDNPWEASEDGNLGEQIWAMDSRSDAATKIHDEFPMVSEPLSQTLAKVFAPQANRLSAGDFRDEILRISDLFDPSYHPNKARSLISNLDDEDQGEVCILVPIVGSNSTTNGTMPRW
jgi:hypothetical protein